MLLSTVAATSVTTFTELSEAIIGGSSAIDITMDLTFTACVSISESVSITSSTSRKCDGASSVRHFDVASGTLTLSYVELSNGNSMENGGSIYVHTDAALIASYVTFNTNQATSGGSIYANTDATLNVSYATFNANRATGNYAGAVFCYGCNSSITYSMFSSNSAASYGGAMLAWNGCMDISHSSFGNNQSPNSCGGGLATYLSLVTVADSTFAQNSAEVSDYLRLEC